MKYPHSSYPTATIYCKTIQTRLDSLRGGGLVLKFGEPKQERWGEIFFNLLDTAKHILQQLSSVTIIRNQYLKYLSDLCETRQETTRIY